MKQMSDKDRIKDVLKKNRVTQAEVAKFLNVNPVCVHEVVAGKRKNPRIRKAISLLVGLPVSELWPDKAKEGK